MATLAWTGHRAARSPVIGVAARFGLAARGIIYLVIGGIALQIARGHTAQQANQKGALATIAQHRGGSVLLWVLGFGLLGYALWRLSEAVFGTAGGERKAGARIASFVRAVVYSSLAVTTFMFVAGKRSQGQDQQQESATARLMQHGYGRVLVGVIGLVVLGVGLGMIVQGVRRSFEKRLRMDELTGTTRTLVVSLGVIGNVARGAVFAVAGALVVGAAVKYQASKSKGLDGALRTLANQPYGPLLLGVAAAGLVAFGLYGLAAARWTRT